MNSPDERLAAFFATDLPPSRDPRFQAEVRHALARRRFATDMMVLSTACAIGATAFWLVGPLLAPIVVDLTRALSPGLVIVVLGAWIWTLNAGRGAVFGS